MNHLALVGPLLLIRLREAQAQKLMGFVFNRNGLQVLAQKKLVLRIGPTIMELTLGLDLIDLFIF
jgi:hydrogenase-4 membrane subunit HyfE